jgi:lipid II:glycine glycyltransferase (peptidoglycan interpeptide bridge formation enzyme)
MDIRIIDNPMQWNEFACGLGAHPMQCWEWGALKEQSGLWKATRLAFFEGEQAVGGAQVLTRSLPFPLRATSYLPRGPFAAQGRLDDILDQTAEWCRANTKSVSLKAEPAVSDYAFPAGWEPSSRMLVDRTVVMDLSLDEDSLMKAIPNRKCRQYIRKAARDGVTVRPGVEEDLDAILALYHATAQADGFDLHEDHFYRQAFVVLGELQQLFVAEQDGELQAFLWNITSPGGTAFELWGAVSETGKRSRANYYLKWVAVLAAKERGALLYDLNGLLNDGISDFKLLFGPEVQWVATHDRPLNALYRVMDKALQIRRERGSRKSTQGYNESSESARS